MILPTDKEYKETKKILLGKSTMNPDFRPLADYIDREFEVRVINIIYDTIDKGKRPRLEINFEFQREARSFDLAGNQFGYDPDKQKKIANEFRHALEKQSIVKRKKWFGIFGAQDQKYKTENIWVIYSAFEPLAKIEANEAIPQNQITNLKQQLDNADLWEISRALGGVTFLLYTDAQVKQYQNSTDKKMWEDRYFDLLEPYNEFGYFKRETFSVYLDSKENFDANYDSNWYYYYK